MPMRFVGRRWVRFAIVALALCGLAACRSAPSLWVFTAPWDIRSDSALALGVASRATIVTGWIALDTAGAAPLALYETRRLAAAANAREHRYALITSYRATRFYPEAVRAIAADSALRQTAADTIAAMVRRGRYEGIVIDFEGMLAADAAAVTATVESIASAARRGGATTVAMAVPALDTGSIPWASLSPSVDRFVVMLYDEHWSNGGPGPIASRAWARAALTKWIALVGPARIVAAIPAYGYAWHPTKPTDVIGFGTLAALASSSGRIVQRDTLSGGLSLDLPDGSTAWFADAALGAAIAKDARALGVTVLALWRLGLEDPAIWSALGHQ